MVSLIGLLNFKIKYGKIINTRLFQGRRKKKTTTTTTIPQSETSVNMPKIERSMQYTVYPKFVVSKNVLSQLPIFSTGFTCWSCRLKSILEISFRSTSLVPSPWSLTSVQFSQAAHAKMAVDDRYVSDQLLFAVW